MNVLLADAHLVSVSRGVSARRRQVNRHPTIGLAQDDPAIALHERTTLMAQRPIWRGHLRLALVSCPIALYSARHERGAIRFNMINPDTGNRIRMVSQDSETGVEIARRDTVKGYEFQKGRYLIVSDQDMQSVKVESSSTMMVEKFVDAGSIDPIYYDASYYVAPDGQGAEDVYAVLREAIQKTGKVALTRVVIAQRERSIAVRPINGGLVAHTLNEEQDLNSTETLFEQVRQIKIDTEMVELAVQLIDRQTGRYDPADFEDRYEARLRAMIDAKLSGEGLSIESEPDDAGGNVIDMMTALRKSLGEPAGSQPAAPTRRRAEAKAPSRGSEKAKRAPAANELRRQSTFKLPIEGGRKAAAPAAATVERPVAERALRPHRKA